MRMVEEIMGEAKELLQQSSGENFLETMGKIKILNDEAYKAVTAGIPFDRLEAICNAEREGRCVVLPSEPKPGEIWISDGIRYYIHAIAFTEGGICIEYWEDNEARDGEILACNPIYFAKHFTRSEAEAALKERE